MSISSSPAAGASSPADSAYQAIQSASSETPAIVSIYAAIAAIVAYIDAVNDLQKTSSDQTSKLALLTKGLSDTENGVLQHDLDTINGINPKDDKDTKAQTALTKAQFQYQQDQSKYNNWIATPQSMTEAWQNSVSDYAKTTTSGYQNLGQLIAISSNLAQDLH